MANPFFTQTFSLNPTTFVIDLPSLIFACIVIGSVSLLVSRIAESLFHWLLIEDNYEHDIETGGIEVVNLHSQSAMERLDRLISAIEERGGRRQRVLDKLVPYVYYKSHQITSISSDCAICLEDFVDGDSCRNLQRCKHMFHLNCIDSWLQNHGTCPICRHQIINA